MRAADEKLIINKLGPNWRLNLLSPSSIGCSRGASEASLPACIIYHNIAGTIIILTLSGILMNVCQVSF